MTPLSKRDFDLTVLFENHPPHWQNPHKRRIFERITQADDFPPSGGLSFSRWSGNLPDDYSPSETRVTARADYFDYLSGETLSSVSWHMNFAHSELFGFYSGPLLAQDEMQVLEHPALGALREALLQLVQTDESFAPLTVDGGRPTPCLVAGVPRACKLNTGPSSFAPSGLYGNEFAAAEWDVVEAHLDILESPTISNIIAMEAPPGGSGFYKSDEVRRILETAYIGFRAASLESQRMSGYDVSVEVHTGFWGCGAYGGNRGLMVLLQIVAARQAGVRDLVVHTGSTGFLPIVEEAEEMARAFSDSSFDEIIQELVGRQVSWGVGDGN